MAEAGPGLAAPAVAAPRHVILVVLQQGKHHRSSAGNATDEAELVSWSCSASVQLSAGVRDQWGSVIIRSA
jgi:hypothetical protein